MSQHRVHALTVAAIAFLGLIGPAAAETAQPPAQYLRIQASEKCVVYIQIQGEELRVATSAAGLTTAVPVAMVGGDGALESPEFPLPVPEDQLPEGIMTVKARFGFVLLNAFGIEEKSPARIYGDIELCRPDNRGAEWACVFSFEARPTTGPEKSPVIAVPGLRKLALAIITAPSDERLGIGLKLTAGNEALSTIRKDGQGVLAAQVWALDDTGHQEVFQRGRLCDFGFGKSAPSFSVELDKGDYTVEAKVDAGPFGVFKAEAQVAVP